jgi:hypothetical protein
MRSFRLLSMAAAEQKASKRHVHRIKRSFHQSQNPFRWRHTRSTPSHWAVIFHLNDASDANQAVCSPLRQIAVNG